MFKYTYSNSNENFFFKVLTAESGKINEQIQENCQAFEQVLTQLHRRRILAQTAVIQVYLSLIESKKQNQSILFILGRIKN